MKNNFNSHETAICLIKCEVVLNSKRILYVSDKYLIFINNLNREINFSIIMFKDVWLAQIPIINVKRKSLYIDMYLVIEEEMEMYFINIFK